MYYGFVKHSKWGLRLNHDVTTSDRSHSKLGLRLIYDVTTSDRSVPTPKFLKIDPRLRGGIRLRVVPYTHSQLIIVQKHFIYI